MNAKPCMHDNSQHRSSLLPHVKDCAVKIMSDNICTVFYMNELGGTHCPQMSLLASDIFEYPYSIQHSMSYLPFAWFNNFSLSRQAFACVIEQLPFPLEVDMFALKCYFKLSHYMKVDILTPRLGKQRISPFIGQTIYTFSHPKSNFKSNR